MLLHHLYLRIALSQGNLYLTLDAEKREGTTYALSGLGAL